MPHFSTAPLDGVCKYAVWTARDGSTRVLQVFREQTPERMMVIAAISKVYRVVSILFLLYHAVLLLVLRPRKDAWEVLAFEAALMVAIYYGMRFSLKVALKKLHVVLQTKKAITYFSATRFKQFDRPYVQNLNAIQHAKLAGDRLSESKLFYYQQSLQVIVSYGGIAQRLCDVFDQQRAWRMAEAIGFVAREIDAEEGKRIGADGKKWSDDGPGEI